MNNHLAPTYQYLFGSFWVCWYSKTNRYTVIENNFKELLDLYYISESIEEFKIALDTYNSKLDSKHLIQNVEDYLYSCNKDNDITLRTEVKFISSKRNIYKQYLIKGNLIDIFYESELIEKTIHPAIAHLLINNNENSDVIFDVYLENGYICLFKNEKLITSVPKRDYHLLQGKFFMQLLSVIYKKNEDEWIATFHGSTIADGINCVLFIGNSGKGKSTLSAILASNGFQLVADDVSPMLAEDSQIYHNPSALSTKQGSFDVLESTVKGFNDLPKTLFNKTKGQLKYIPFKDPSKSSYPCKAIIMVNYSKNSETLLETIPIKNILETLIPESWLSPNPKHSQLFLEWLQSVKIYQLTYSDTNSVMAELSELFRKLKD